MIAPPAPTEPTSSAQLIKPRADVRSNVVAGGAASCRACRRVVAHLPDLGGEIKQRDYRGRSRSDPVRVRWLQEERAGVAHLLG
jgi:hypothetical protein